MRKILYLFSKFTDQDIDWFVEAGGREDIKKGHILVRQGQPIERLYITLSGSFEVKSDEAEIATIGAGEVVGELSFLDSRPPNASVIALEESVVLGLSVNRLRSKLRVDNGFASRFYFALAVMLADRMRHTVHQLALGPGLSLDDSVEEFGEISAELLDDTGIAAARFDKLRHTVLSV